MHGIGEFARMAKVSVRTLRHYNDLGILNPASIDPTSGYRSYTSDQLTDLYRILALKDAGLSLGEVREFSDASGEEIAKTLQKRLEEMERALEQENRRIDRLRARIKQTKGEHPMTDPISGEHDISVVVKPLDAHHLAIASATANDFEVDFGPIFAELYPVIYRELGRLGITPGAPAIAFYEVLDDGRVGISAGLPLSSDMGIDINTESESIEARTLPAAMRGATLVHRGSMATIDQSYLALDQWVRDAGEVAVGYSREVYHACPPDQADWVTELQFVLAE